jgi:hypothetical protein
MSGSDLPAIVYAAGVGGRETRSYPDFCALHFEFVWDCFGFASQ